MSDILSKIIYHNMCRHITAILLAAFALMGCLSCQKGGLRHKISFYHWKSSYQVDEEVRSYTKELGCEKVYLHYYDVVKDGNIVRPINFLRPIEKNILHQDSVHFVPVIYIENDVFKDVDLERISQIGTHVSSLNQTMFRHMGTGNFHCEEIQFDCDWTQSTRDNYFSFLSFMQEHNPDMKITSTIRLHQIKDRETMGIPPVGKGYLMCYATSGVDDGLDSNSILDIDLLKNYTQDLNSYPLALDYALPLFSWGIVSNQKGNVKLVNGLTNSDMDETRFKKIGENKYEVLEDCFLNGLYINEGFTIEIEEITPTLVRSAIQYLDEKLKKEYTIVYFHLSKGFLKRYSIDDLK